MRPDIPLAQHPAVEQVVGLLSASPATAALASTFAKDISSLLPAVPAKGAAKEAQIEIRERLDAET